MQSKRPPTLSSDPALLTSLLLTLGSGFLLVLALPPRDVWPLALVALVPFYIVLRTTSPRRAFLTGWLFGWIINAGGYLWSADRLSDFLSLPSWAGVALMLLLAAYQGLALALWAWASRWTTTRSRLPMIVVAPLLLAVAESALPLIFKHYIGFALWRAWPLIQVAEIGGAAAVSALLLLINAVIAEAILARRGDATAQAVWRAGLAVMALLLLAGTLRGAHVASARQRAPRLRVGIVQSNFGLTSADARDRYGADYVRALQQDTSAISAQGAELVVWGESAWPYPFDRKLEREYAPGHPWELRPGSSSRLLAGMLTHEYGTGNDIYDSMVLFSESGEIAGRHDKARMLFLLERIPFEDHFPALIEELEARMPPWRPHITPGTEANLLVDGDLRIAPLVCSEELLADYVSGLARQGANLLVTVGSDAWFPPEAAYQHMALAAFRAVETRRDLVRGMNNGISALIDARGQLIARSDYVDVPPDQPPSGSDTLLVDAALLEIPAVGPYTVPYFPYAALLLVIAGARLLPREEGRETR